MAAAPDEQHRSVGAPRTCWALRAAHAAPLVALRRPPSGLAAQVGLPNLAELVASVPASDLLVMLASLFHDLDTLLEQVRRGVSAEVLARKRCGLRRGFGVRKHGRTLAVKRARVYGSGPSSSSNARYVSAPGTCAAAVVKSVQHGCYLLEGMDRSLVIVSGELCSFLSTQPKALPM